MNSKSADEEGRNLLVWVELIYVGIMTRYVDTVYISLSI